MLSSRREDRLAHLATEIEAPYYVADVRNERDRKALVKATISKYGSVDILVNNAGVASTSPAESVTSASFRHVLETNLVAPFALARECALHMLPAGRGCIINVASILGIVGVGQIPDAAYAASKGGLVNLTRELSAQWSRRGVRVNALAPGYFDSEMTAAFFEDDRSSQWLARRDPMGRSGRAGELDGALLFLASDASSYVTGHVLVVDGGWTSI
jgi:NAD(P)-dependent dehydrogenase (short-subunit alcohol dehydrogenase family)